MHLINSSAEVIKESNPYKLVEKIGRTCYKSEDKITDGSCQKFFTNLVKHQHFAILEHARLYFEIECPVFKCIQWRQKISDIFKNIPQVFITSTVDNNITSTVDKNYNSNDALVRYDYIGLSISMSYLYNPKWKSNRYHDANLFMQILRSKVEPDYLPEGGIYETEKELYLIFDYVITPYITYYENPDESKCHAFSNALDEFITIKFTCDRGVSYELARYRCAVAQESTRYCNYTKDKFSAGDIEFIYPHDYDIWDDTVKLNFINLLSACESTYNYMISKNMSPQQARTVLPNALKTEIILTMNNDQWDHFFDVRYRGVTGAPHPDIKEVAEKAYDAYVETIAKSSFSSM